MQQSMAWCHTADIINDRFNASLGDTIHEPNVTSSMDDNTAMTSKNLLVLTKLAQ
jgi:hypothetical protein